MEFYTEWQMQPSEDVQAYNALIARWLGHHADYNHYIMRHYYAAQFSTRVFFDDIDDMPAPEDVVAYDAMILRWRERMRFGSPLEMQTYSAAYRETAASLLSAPLLILNREYYEFIGGGSRGYPHHTPGRLVD